MKKFFGKRSVAMVVMVLGIVAGIALGRINKPADLGPASTVLSGTYHYVLDSEGVISQKTAEYIDAMNDSLFAQTGAQIVVQVVDTTGAGDAFWGGFLNCLLNSGKHPRDVSLSEAMEFADFANALASLCVEKRGAIPAMPTLETIEKRRMKGNT